MILEGVWRATGIEPPRSANVIALFFSFGTLAIVFATVMRMRLATNLQPARFGLAVGALAYLLVNRTFLMWTSSGLETALFTFCVTVWAVALWWSARDLDPRAIVTAAGAGAAAALAHPEGALCAGAAGLAALHATAVTRRPRTLACSALALSPAALHLLWRRAYYGDWVPNTYYAKIVEPWPESGEKYLESFLLEYVLGAVAVVLLLAVARMAMDRLDGGDATWPVRSWVPRVLVLAALAVHVGYITLVVGGDHFEYRVFACLVPLIALALTGALARLDFPPLPSLTTLGVVAALSVPIPLVHHLRSQERQNRDQSFFMMVPVADAFPAGVIRDYVARFDERQGWLIGHAVGMRHQEHRVFHLFETGRHGARAAGRGASPQGRLVIASGSVGVLGWVFPEAVLLDACGLNNRVVALTPMPPGRTIRFMAHERFPPPGYFECFTPKDAVSDATIAECERKYHGLLAAVQ